MVHYLLVVKTFSIMAKIGKVHVKVFDSKKTGSKILETFIRSKLEMSQKKAHICYKINKLTYI